MIQIKISREEDQLPEQLVKKCILDYFHLTLGKTEKSVTSIGDYH